jgi:hypothetical protein
MVKAGMEPPSASIGILSGLSDGTPDVQHPVFFGFHGTRYVYFFLPSLTKPTGNQQGAWPSHGPNFLFYC